MKLLRGSIVFALAWLLQSCFDSDDHLFDEADAVEISVEASVARSITTSNQGIKADTFNIGDTVYFLTTVNPSKLINVQDYHWLMDGVYCSSEYNFKKEITEPGYHKFTFVLKDHFGDMHYDSLEIWAADPPTLNDTAFTPAQGTQAIDPHESIYFTWSASTEGVQLAHKFHFTLSEQNFTNEKAEFINIDTILNEPHYIYHNKLNPFKKYNWTVQAYNEYGFSSKEQIESFFYTKGLPGEGSLHAVINTRQDTQTPVRLTLKSKTPSVKEFNYDFIFTKAENEVSLGAIPAGKYLLQLSSENSDFDTLQKDIVINDGFVTLLQGLTLTDSVKPTITSVSGRDTLNFADTLKFIVKDGGSSISARDITVRLESELVTEKKFRDSVLTVVFSDKDKSWTYRLLSIFVTDASNNTASRSFYLTPGELWFTANNDTTIASTDNISLFFEDHNPFGFKVDSLKVFNVTQNKYIALLAIYGKSSFSADIEAPYFDEFQTIRTTIVYMNGISQSKEWNLNVTKVQEEN